VTPYTPVEISRRFRGTSPGAILLGVHFDCEDGGDIIVRNSAKFCQTIRRYLPDYLTLKVYIWFLGAFKAVAGVTFKYK
jgi:hypothetical protein